MVIIYTVYKFVYERTGVGFSKAGLRYLPGSDYFQRCKNAQKALKLQMALATDKRKV